MEPDVGRISFCDPAEQPDDPEKISFCDPTKAPEDDKIVFCNKCGSDVEEMQISGDEAPTVGSSYSVSGGKAPYKWSISAGSINSLGEITDLSGACGTGSVSVTDACGTTASMDVRFPSGQWVQESFEYWTDDPPHCSGYYDYQYTAIEYEGTRRVTKVYCCASSSSPYGYTCTTIPICCTYCTLYSMNSYFDSDYGKTNVWKRVYQYSVKIDTWECS